MPATQRGAILETVKQRFVKQRMIVVIGVMLALTGLWAQDDVEPQIVSHLQLKSIIHPIAAQYIEDALQQADESGATAVVIELDTPGGLMTSTRDITEAMLVAKTPVVIYVSPSGAQAASAGFFLLMAADVAVMAPGTNTGAAHPVSGSGEEIEGHMAAKVEEDAAANIRALASRLGRNIEAAEAAVIESKSYTADEALELGLIDFVSPSVTDLVAKLDGRTVSKSDGAELTLATQGTSIEPLPMTKLQRFLAALAHPNIAFLLLSLGGMGLLFEITHPGSIFPGVVGAIFLLLAFFGLSVLPVNYVGIGLLGLAVLFFIAEIKVVSYGLLTVAGIISMVLGSSMLFKSTDPALQVSWGLIGTTAALAALAVVAAVTLVIRSHRRQVATGNEGMIGRIAEVRTALNPRGKVFVHGELWDAESSQLVDRGQEVRVVAVNGMRLEVESLISDHPNYEEEE